MTAEQRYRDLDPSVGASLYLSSSPFPYFCLARTKSFPSSITHLCPKQACGSKSLESRCEISNQDLQIERPRSRVSRFMWKREGDGVRIVGERCVPPRQIGSGLSPGWGGIIVRQDLH
jgi:hypothetical protein